MGLGRAFPRSESGTKPAAVKPTLYSEEEIAQMMSTTPPELARVGSIETPVGTWSMDGGIVIFDAKAATEIAKITKVSMGRRLKGLATKIFQMS